MARDRSNQGAPARIVGRASVYSGLESGNVVVSCGVGRSPFVVASPTTAAIRTSEWWDQNPLGTPSTRRPTDRLGHRTPARARETATIAARLTSNDQSRVLRSASITMRLPAGFAPSDPTSSWWDHRGLQRQ